LNIRQQHGNKAAGRLWRNRGMGGPDSRPPSDVLGALPESNILTDG